MLVHRADVLLKQFGILYYLPLYYQGVKGYSPIIAGVALVRFSNKMHENGH